jgi:hypothetical protein
MSENDNKIKSHNNVITSNRNNVNGNVETLKMNFTDRGVLPRARIVNESVLDASGVDYNLRTQTIGRYKPERPIQPKTSVHLKKVSSNKSIVNIPSSVDNLNELQLQKQPKPAYSSHTLPIIRRDNQKRNTVNHMGNNPNYISLESALNCKALHQMTPTQGWALLCQSVQALQDLFLSGELNIEHYRKHYFIDKKLMMKWNFRLASFHQFHLQNHI